MGDIFTELAQEHPDVADELATDVEQAVLTNAAESATVRRAGRKKEVPDEVATVVPDQALQNGVVLR